MDGHLPPQSEPGSQASRDEAEERPEPVAALIRRIERAHGYLPATYLPALDARDVLVDLWQHTRRAYLDNPLPGPFKERLLTYLGRHCAAPFCLLVHGCALLEQGARPDALRALLEAPARPSPTELAQDLERLSSASGTALRWPEPGSPLEGAVLRCAEAIFLRHQRAPRCREALKAYLGPRWCPRLFALLGYAQGLNLWTENHPELCFVPDALTVAHFDELLAAVPELGRLVASLPVGDAAADRRVLVAASERPMDDRVLLRVSEQTSDFVYRMRVQPQRAFEYASPSIEWITGFAPEEYYQDPDLPLKLVHEEDREELLELLTCRPHLIAPRVVRTRRRSGELQWLEHRVAAELDARGEVIAIEGIARDVTERVRGEQLLRDSERLLRTVFESLQDAVLVITPEHRIVAMNHAAEQMFGYRSAELAEGGARLLHVDGAEFERFLSRLDGALASGAVARLHHAMRRKSGELFPAEHTVTALRGPGGESMGFVSLIRDETARQRSERAVRTSEARWRSLAENAARHVVTLAPDFTITFSNRDFDEEHPLRAGTPLLDNVPPEARELMRGALEHAARSLETVKVDCCGFEREGQPTYFRVRVVPLTREQRLTELLLTCTDVTELKRTAAALRESEARWRLLVENAPQYIVTVEPDLRISFLNRAFDGAPVDSILGTSALSWVVPSSRARARSCLDRALRTGEPTHYEVETFTRSGARVWFEISAARLVRGDGSRALLLNSRDISDRKRAEQRLRDSEQRWREILQNAPNTILRLDLHGRITFVNNPLPAAGRGPLAGRSVYDLVPAEFRRELEAILQRVVATGQRVTFEMTGLGPAGTGACFQNSVGPLTVRGRVESLILISTDITDRKRAEKALRESEERFRAVFEHGPVGMAIVSPDLRLQRVNRTFCEMLGYDEHDCPGMPMERTYPPLQARHYFDLARRLFAGTIDRIDLERPLVTRSGGTVWGHVTASVVRDAEARPLYGLWMFEDIDERRRAEEALRRSAAQLAEAQRLAHVGSWSWSFVDDSFEYSDELLRIYAMRREEVGHEYRALLARVHPEDRARVKEVVRSTLEEHGPYDFEHRILRPDGEVRILRSRGFVERDAADRPQRIYGTVEDVTEARRALEERTRLYREAQAALRTRDEFLSIASHDLKTPLNALRLQVQSLTRAVRGSEHDRLRPENLLPRLEGAERQIDKLVKLLGLLLDVSRISAGRMELDYERLDLGAVVCELVSRAEEGSETRGAELHLRVPEPVIGRWDRLRLEQVLTNLLSNAAKYGEGRPVDVEVVREGQNARISVRDRGQGIAPEDQERIFDRFERAAGKHEGSFGLGLWIVRRVVEAMQGTVTVSSVKNRGATFTVILPLEPRA